MLLNNARMLSNKNRRNIFRRYKIVSSYIQPSCRTVLLLQYSMITSDIQFMFKRFRVNCLLSDDIGFAINQWAKAERTGQWWSEIHSIHIRFSVVQYFLILFHLTLINHRCFIIQQYTIYLSILYPNISCHIHIHSYL